MGLGGKYFRLCSRSLGNIFCMIVDSIFLIPILGFCFLTVFNHQARLVRLNLSPDPLARRYCKIISHHSRAGDLGSSAQRLRGIPA